ncbi:hypothetical protein ACIQM3_08750 [Streptomyces sp. NPDC091271]
MLAGDIPWSEIVEETLRWAPSTANLTGQYSWAVEDIELHALPVRLG